MTVKASRGIGGWLVAVTTWARGEDAPRVSLFNVARPDPKDAMDAVQRACGAPADAVAVKAHLTKGALALMRIEPGHMRMRKSLKRPRDIHELTRRIRDITTRKEESRSAPEANDTA
jgi:hypothetical protein